MGWQDDWDADQRAEAAYREWAERERAKGNEDRAEHWHRVADGIARRGDQRRQPLPRAGGRLGCGFTLPVRVLGLPVILLYRWWTQSESRSATHRAIT